MNKRTGFTMVELLIVVAIIGIIAAIAIPNLLVAVRRGKQKRTMADMRTVASTLESYAIDQSEFPYGEDGTVSELVGALEPTYIKTLPLLDGWHNAYVYQVNSSLADYTLISYADDGVRGGPIGVTTNYDDDIVLHDGIFTSWPEGVQKE